MESSGHIKFDPDDPKLDKKYKMIKPVTQPKKNK